MVASIEFNLNFVTHSVAMLITLLALGACGGEKKDIDSFFTDKSGLPEQVNASEADSGLPVPVGESEADEDDPIESTDDILAGSKDHFAVGLHADTKYVHRVHQTDSDQAECKIEKGSANRGIECQVEVSEGDLYAQGASLHISVPPKMCDYVKFNNYYYYNFEAGAAPDAVTVHVFKNPLGAINSIDCIIDGVFKKDCHIDTGHNELYFDIEGELQCVYDHSLTNSDHPNCCFGNRTITTLDVSSNIVADGSGAVTYTYGNPSIDRGNWGGSYAACMGGPAITDSNWPKNFKGFPLSTLNTTYETGYNFKYDVTAPIDKISGNNVNAANYYTKLDTTGNSIHKRSKTVVLNGATQTITSSWPKAINPIGDRSSTVSGSKGVANSLFGGSSSSTLRYGHDSYKFSCLDANFEVLYAIDLYIREWNTLSEFLVYINDPKVSNINPDAGGLSGQEGSECQYYNSSSRCNDKSDWDDYASYTSSYPKN